MKVRISLIYETSRRRQEKVAKSLMHQNKTVEPLTHTSMIPLQGSAALSRSVDVYPFDIRLSFILFNVTLVALWAQVSEYGAAVLLLLMATFLLISHWLACVFYAIAHWERPLLHAPVGWLDHLANLTGTLAFFLSSLVWKGACVSYPSLPISSRFTSLVHTLASQTFSQELEPYFISPCLVIKLYLDRIFSDCPSRPHSTSFSLRLFQHFL